MKALARAEETAPSPQALLEAIANVAARRREGEGMVDERALAVEAQALLQDRHPADIAYVLEGLPLEDRLWIWGMVRSDHDGEILLEVSDAVRDTLLEDMDSAEMVAAAQNLDADEIADLAPDLPREVVQDIIESQDVEDRAQLQSALSYPEGTVGALMDFEVVSIREDATVEAALRDLRRFDVLPPQTDALFVVDRDKRLRGTLPLARILVADPDVAIASVYEREAISFAPESDADEVAQAFDRYDLVCAPVVDASGRIVGRITVDAVLEYVRDRQEAQALGKVGLREEEDIFASVWSSAKNARRLLAKELGISALNGALWGGVLGIVAGALYRNVELGGVMALAMLLNLVVAALAGIFIPLAMERFGRDPAVGSSVFLTFVTDSMGFLIFLGLATIFLL